MSIYYQQIKQFYQFFFNFFSYRDLVFFSLFFIFNVVSQNYLINLFLLLVFLLLYFATISLGEDNSAQNLFLKKKSIFYSCIIFFYSLFLVSNFVYTPNSFYFK